MWYTKNYSKLYRKISIMKLEKIRNIINSIIFNIRKIIERIPKKVIIAFIILIILWIIFGIIDIISNKILEKDAKHGVVVESDAKLYTKPKESKWMHKKDFKLGENVYILKEEEKQGKIWYKVKTGKKIGYVLKGDVDFFEFSDEEIVLMSDVSKFNVLYKHFTTAGEFEAFILKSNINYVYIRAGGRGYGEKGNFYTDPNFEIFIEACEYLGVPYGFYYIDEAINSEEIDEEVEFMEKFIKENATDLCVLPLVIDIEKHDGTGRADQLWEERASLATELIQKFKEKDIETLIYSNANLINEYLYTIDTKFWIAYYDLAQKVPNHWYTETDEEAAENKEFTDKIIGWQFTESGAGDDIPYPVDISVVKNAYFKKYVTESVLEKK